MHYISLEEAQNNLPNLVHGLMPGEEVIITENSHPVARLMPAAVAASTRRLGALRGTVTYMAPDFDAPLDDFKEYMQ